MVEIGKYNTLTVVKIVDFGVYLDGGERGEILMPKEYVPTNCSPDDEVEVFVYFDSEDRIVATTEIPAIQVGEFAFLKVVAVSKVGAFLGWGLRKDLFVPFREQRDPMVEGKSYWCMLMWIRHLTGLLLRQRLRNFWIRYFRIMNREKK